MIGTAPAVVAGWDNALRETKAAASRAARVLRIGFMSSAANEATQQIMAAFARRRPGWRVDMRQAARQRHRPRCPGLRPLLPGQQAA